MDDAYRYGAMETQGAKTSETRVGKKVLSSEQLAEMVEQITETARRMFNASGSSVLLLDKEGSELVFKVATGKAGQRLRGLRISKLRGIASWVALHGEPLIVNDVSKDWRFDKIVDKVTGFVTRSVMCTPLVDHGEVLGVIEVVKRLDGTGFSENDLKTLASIAHVAVMPISNARQAPIR